MIRTGFVVLFLCLSLGSPQAGRSQENVHKGQGSSFAVLKADRVNIRRGPSFDHAVQWEYRRRGVPVEIISSFDHWRRIRDVDGDIGWVHFSLLNRSGRGAVVRHKQEEHLALQMEADADSQILVKLESGVVLDVLECLPEWCRVGVEGWEGWVMRSGIWGVPPGELF